MDNFKCENCGKSFDEFEMDYKAAQIDKKKFCRSCRQNFSYAIKTPAGFYVTDKGKGFWGLTEKPDTVFESAEAADNFIKEHLGTSSFWQIEPIVNSGQK